MESDSMVEFSRNIKEEARPSSSFAYLAQYHISMIICPTLGKSSNYGVSSRLSAHLQKPSPSLVSRYVKQVALLAQSLHLMISTSGHSSIRFCHPCHDGLPWRTLQMFDSQHIVHVFGIFIS